MTVAHDKTKQNKTILGQTQRSCKEQFEEECPW